MKSLIEALEVECSDSQAQRDRFLALKAELAAIKERLKPLDTQ